MSHFIAIVLLVLPAQPGQAAPTVELHREFVAASSQAVCQQHADKLAAEQRRVHAATVERMKARVVGTCTPLEPRP